MKALIASGGHGTRLQPITHTQNKHLIPIANKPMLFYALETVAEAGIEEVGVVVNQGDSEVRGVLEQGERWGLNITYLEQGAPLGVAHVVKIAEDFIKDEPFLFYLGDNMVVGGVKGLVEEFKRKKSNCHLALANVKDPGRFGVAEIGDGLIINIEEKPKAPKSPYAVAGVYIYDHHIFEAVNNINPSARGELEISEAHQFLLDKGFKVTYSEITGWWKDTGEPIDLLEANRLVLSVLKSSKLEGEIDEESFVTDSVVIQRGARIVRSQIRGPAIIGENTIIEDSYIGPFTSIHFGCKIIKSEVEYSVVLENCKISDVGIRIEGSLLGKDVEIIKANGKPRTHRFMIGDKSRVELV